MQEPFLVILEAKATSQAAPLPHNDAEKLMQKKYLGLVSKFFAFTGVNDVADPLEPVTTVPLHSPAPVV